jgi:acyl-CoA-binding protein
MSLEQRSKKELVELIHQLQDKLKELANVEKQATAQLSELKSPGIGLIKDKDGYYSLVKLKYDSETKAAAVESIDKLDSRDEAIVVYKLKQYTVENIMRKARGGKYDI